MNPTSYHPRIVDREIDELLPGLPAISLDGPKGVGKTATAERRAGTVLRMDRSRDRIRVSTNPQMLTAGKAPVLIDEWQRWPEIWDEVRRAVDDGAAPASFLLTGSASPAATIHSGAGRIVSIRMRPMTLAERGIAEPTVSLAALLKGNAEVGGDTSITLSDYVREIIQSGLPGIREAASERVIRSLLDGYLERLFDHEIAEAGAAIRRPATLRAWLAAYAAATSTTASLETIRDAATGDQVEKPAKTTSISYRDLLMRLWILDPVDPWLPSNNRLHRLNAAPKHQLTDPALAARLLDLTTNSLLKPSAEVRNQPVDLLGNLFESLVTLDVRVAAQAAEARVGHLRTRGGDHEVDLVVTGTEGQVLAIEVKLTAAPDDHDVRHLRWLRDKIGDRLVDAVVVTAGAYAYRRTDGIAVIPACLLGP